MNVLVLGATSVIGSEIATAFAPHNSVLLVGRDPAGLRGCATRCDDAGAEQTVELPYDLTAGAQALAETVSRWNIDVVINAASATSRLRDSSIEPARLAEYFTVDVLAPLELIRLLAARAGNKGLRILYISSVLAVTRSPNRAIYASLKAIHEHALMGLAASNPFVKVQIVRVATIVNTDQRSSRATALAKAVRSAFDRGRPLLTYGLSGRLAAALYFTQPLLYDLVIRLARLLSGRHRGL